MIISQEDYNKFFNGMGRVDYNQMLPLWDSLNPDPRFTAEVTAEFSEGTPVTLDCAVNLDDIKDFYETVVDMSLYPTQKTLDMAMGVVDDVSDSLGLKDALPIIVIGAAVIGVVVLLVVLK